MRSVPRRATSTVGRGTVGTRRAPLARPVSRSAPTFASTVATTNRSPVVIANATSVGRRARASRGVDANRIGPDARRRVAARVMLRIVRSRSRPGADRRGRSIDERGSRCDHHRGRIGRRSRERVEGGATARSRPGRRRRRARRARRRPPRRQRRRGVGQGHGPAQRTRRQPRRCGDRRAGRAGRPRRPPRRRGAGRRRPRGQAGDGAAQPGEPLRRADRRRRQRGARAGPRAGARQPGDAAGDHHDRRAGP